MPAASAKVAPGQPRDGDARAVVELAAARLLPRAISSLTVFGPSLARTVSSEVFLAVSVIAAEILERIVVHGRAGRRIHHQRACPWRPSSVWPSGGGLGDELRADAGAGAGPVLDHDALVPELTELLADDAHVDVGRSAGRERHGDLDRPVGEARRVAALCRAPMLNK